MYGLLDLSVDRERRGWKGVLKPRFEFVHGLVIDFMLYEQTKILCFSIPFNLYVHDQHSNQADHTHTWVANMHVPPILAFWCIV